MKFEFYEDANNEWCWQLLGNSGEILADSAGPHVSKEECRNQIDAVRRCMSAKVVQIVLEPKIETPVQPESVHRKWVANEPGDCIIEIEEAETDAEAE